MAGDTGCFACLLDKYSRPVHSLILKTVRNKEDAEELAQDVFMKVFRNLPSFKGDCSFSTWIYRIAYNTAISELPPDERALILLFYHKEKTIEELTVITGLSASNAKVKLHRIRKKLFVLIKGMEEQ